MSEEEIIKELKHKIKVNERSRRKMQQSLMKKIERLHSIIKEVREYIEELLKEEIEVTDIDSVNYGKMCQRAYFSDSELDKVLEILDKVEENK